MKKRVKKFMALALAASLALTACGGSKETASTSGSENGEAATTNAAADNPDRIKDWVTYITRTGEVETFFLLGSERSEDFKQIGNLYEGLLETDNYSRIKGALAEDWGKIGRAHV